MNEFRVIDENNWKRAVHCRIFRDSVQPAYCITCEVDLTKFLGQLRERRQSFTFSMIYAVTACANAIEEFRYRFVDGRILLPFSIQAHHSFVDGYHMGKLAESLQSYVDEYGS